MKVFVVDNGSQWTHLQFRALGNLKVDTKVVPNTTPVDELEKEKLDGLVLSGGAARVGLDGRLGAVGDYLDRLDMPIMGVCAGHQYMAKHFGGQAAPGKGTAEFGMVEVDVLEPDDILRDVPGKTVVWASHHDEVSVLPPGFKILASSPACPVQVMRHEKRPLFGLSFHPEVRHTQHGGTIFRNFIRICDEYKRRATSP